MSIEQSQIAAFLSTLVGGDFIALPPSRESVDQEEGHDEARAVAAKRRDEPERGVLAPSVGLGVRIGLGVSEGLVKRQRAR